MALANEMLPAVDIKMGMAVAASYDMESQLEELQDQDDHDFQEKGRVDETSVASAEDVNVECENDCDAPLDGVGCKEGCRRYVKLIFSI
jgi:hypothetical protein